MKQLFTFLAILSLAQATFSQYEDAADSTNYVDEESNVISETFSSTRIINGHSIETLNKGVLEFRVEHRFGDIGGAAGGAQTLFGLDNSADIRIFRIWNYR
jgi:hypothetical protein